MSNCNGRDCFAAIGRDCSAKQAEVEAEAELRIELTK